MQDTRLISGLNVTVLTNEDFVFAGQILDIGPAESSHGLIVGYHEQDIKNFECLLP